MWERIQFFFYFVSHEIIFIDIFVVVSHWYTYAWNIIIHHEKQFIHVSIVFLSYKSFTTINFLKIIWIFAAILMYLRNQCMHIIAFNIMRTNIIFIQKFYNRILIPTWFLSYLGLTATPLKSVCQSVCQLSVWRIAESGWTW